MEKKTTKKENLGNIKEALIRAVVNNVISDYEYQTYEKFIDHEIELLDKKALSRGTTATQEENAKIAKIILDILSTNQDEKYTITQLLDFEELADFKTLSGKKLSNQKINAIITQLKNNNQVVNIKEKKTSFYKIA